MHRRNFVLSLLSLLVLSPISALAEAISQSWNKAAFETAKINEAIKNLAINNETVSKEIKIIAPDRAENGAIVQVEIRSNLPNTESIAILVEKNPTPLIATFNFKNGAEPYVITRIKMAETSDIKIIVKADGQYFTNAKNVVVLENGCG